MKPLYTFLTGCLLIISQYGFPQTWNGSISSNWNTAANWTPSTVPGISSTVIINNASATYQPALTGNVNIASLNLSQGILNLGGYTLTCSGNASLTGDSLMNGKVMANNFTHVTNMHMGGKIIFEKTGPANGFWEGNNKLYGDTLVIIWRWGALHLENNASSPDSIFGHFNVKLADNYSVYFSLNSPLYVQNNLIIDNIGNGTFYWNTSYNTDIGGNLLGLNFSSSTPDLQLENITTLGNNSNGPFYAHTASVNNCNLNGNISLVSDSNVAISIHNSTLSGADNLFQAGNLDLQNNKFGQTGTGLTILRAAHNFPYTVYMRDGNNKFLGNVQWETYAVYPGNLTIQQTFFGADTCLGNMSFILKGNSALTTNGNGYNYVAGNVTIDGQGARKWVEFTGGAGNSFSVAGNFTFKNFTPFPEAGVGITNVYLHNLNVAGTDTMGTFYCFTGDINGCSFKGNLKLIADSSQAYVINNSSLLGADNIFQGGNLGLQNNYIGQQGTGLAILKAAHNLAFGVYMRDGNNKFLGDVEWDAISPPTGSIGIQQTFFGADTCLGNLSINLTGSSSADLAGNNLYIGKGLSLQNNGSGTIVHNNGATAIYFIGTDTSGYVYGGSGSAPSLQNIGINRRGGLRLMSPLTCSGIILTRGIILSSLINSMQMPNSAVVVGGGDSSYIDGPMKKTGNTAFTFPLGKNNVYAPLSITAPAVATDEFRAQYFNHLANDDGYDSSQHDILLNHLSSKEYWLLDRTIGTSSAKVTLSWKTIRSGDVNAMADLRVAHWNGTTWKDEGNGNTTGTNAEGTIQSLNTISSFSPFTLASVSINNALPVSYISFEAQLNANRTVLLRWKTGEEINNDHFEVERSVDGTIWISLEKVNRQASREYIYTDAFPQLGSNYYRIKQVDRDNKYLYTPVKVVKLRNEIGLFIWPNPASDELRVQLPFAKGSIEILDIAGSMISKNKITSHNTVIPTRQLKAGVYVLRIRNQNETYVEKFVKE